MKKVLLAVVGVAALVGPAVASAQTANLSDLAGRVKAGTSIIVYDDLQHGRRLRFKDVTNDTLTGDEPPRGWTRAKPEAVSIPQAQIRRIVEERNDGLEKGVGLGLAIGGGLALVGAAGCAADARYNASDCLMGGMLIYALPGVVIGALIDHAIKEKVTIYEASRPVSTPSLHLSMGPLLARRAVGAQIALGF